jgi:methionine sulfoxide reductase heme-binding subunit
MTTEETPSNPNPNPTPVRSQGRARPTSSEPAPARSEWAEFGGVMKKLAMVVGVALFILFFSQNTAVGSWLALLAPFGDKTAWFLTRSTGLIAYLFLTASTAWGILLSTKLVKEQIPPPVALELHNTLSWLALAFTAIHAFLLLYDTYFTYSLAHLLIPFIGPYKPLWVGLGTVALYLMLLINLSFYLRKKIGQQKWRLLHYAAFAIFIFATLHGFMAGTDSGATGMRLLYGLSGGLILFLVNYRLLSRPAPRPARGGTA